MNPLGARLQLAIRAAREAGGAILAISRADLSVREKSDRSPVTLADETADRLITARLAESGIPCVSEESLPDPELAGSWETFWLVDPLDGTKDFLAGNGEFTVNIALIERGAPVLGVVHAPALDELYFAAKDQGAFRVDAAAERRIASVRAGPGLIAAESRFHGDPEMDLFCSRAGVTRRIPCGSALKFCRLAEGAVDVYPRFVGSSEWDTAAGHRIALEAGCRVTDAGTGLELAYGKPRFRNPSFIAASPRFAFLARKGV